MNSSLLGFSIPIIFAMILTLLALNGSIQRADQTPDRKVSRIVRVALVVWVAAAIGLSVAGFFVGLPGEAVPRVALMAVPLTLAWASATLWTPLRRLIDRIPVSELIGIQAFRAIGVMFLIGWAIRLVPAEFALPAGIGDLMVGVLAPSVASRLRTGGASAKWWNYVGIADLIIALTLGVMTVPGRLDLIHSSCRTKRWSDSRSSSSRRCSSPWAWFSTA